jgi:predicted kinase
MSEISVYIDSLTIKEMKQIAQKFTKSQRKAARNFLREMGIPVFGINDNAVIKLLYAFVNARLGDVRKFARQNQEVQQDESPREGLESLQEVVSNDGDEN